MSGYSLASARRLARVWADGAVTGQLAGKPARQALKAAVAACEGAIIGLRFAPPELAAVRYLLGLAERSWPLDSTAQTERRRTACARAVIVLLDLETPAPAQAEDGIRSQPLHWRERAAGERPEADHD
jgi:hypothetical protein